MLTSPVRIIGRLEIEAAWSKYFSDVINAAFKIITGRSIK